jgi:hypothetical protein
MDCHTAHHELSRLFPGEEVSHFQEEKKKGSEPALRLLNLHHVLVVKTDQIQAKSSTRYIPQKVRVGEGPDVVIIAIKPVPFCRGDVMVENCI